MTVKELIEALKAYPLESQVVVYSGEDGYDNATGVKQVHLALNFSDAYWRGRHQDADATHIHPEWDGKYAFAVCVS